MGHAAQSLHPRQVHPPRTDRTAGQVIIRAESGIWTITLKMGGTLTWRFSCWRQWCACSGWVSFTWPKESTRLSNRGGSLLGHRISNKIGKRASKARKGYSQKFGQPPFRKVGGSPTGPSLTYHVPRCGVETAPPYASRRLINGVAQGRRPGLGRNA